LPVTFGTDVVVTSACGLSRVKHIYHAAVRHYRDSTSKQVCCFVIIKLCNYYYLACSAKLPIGLYILLALISFFFYFLFLMIAWRTIISGSAGPIFAIFSPNESVFSADDRFRPFFRYLKGHCHSSQFCEKMANSPHLLLWHSETEWDVATSVCALTA